jgi:uncharacterized protein YerC
VLLICSQVSAAQFQLKGEKFIAKEAESEEVKKKRAASIAAIKKRERALDWGADEGIDDGRGIRIVILKGMFEVQELT